MVIHFSNFIFDKSILFNLFEEIIVRNFFSILHVPDYKEKNINNILNIIKNDKNLIDKYENYEELKNLINNNRFETFKILSHFTKNKILEFFLEKEKEIN